MDKSVVHYNVGHRPQPRALFKPGSWLTKIDFINHLVLFNNVLVTVLAEKKGGKTSFSTLLQNSLDQQVKTIALTLKPPCDKEDLISAIAKALQLSKDKNTTIESLVEQINERKIHTLCLIDDAHHLSDEVIRTFMTLIKKQNDFGFFHLCLISDYSLIPSLDELTAKEQFANLIHTVELGALNESESRTYVLQRAIEAALINKPLTEAQFRQFHQLTKGNLARINADLEEYIESCASKNSKPKKTAFPKIKLTFGAALVVAVVFSGLYYYQKSMELAKPVPPSALTLNRVPVVAKPVQLTSYLPSFLEGATHQYVEIAWPKKEILIGLEEEQTLNTEAIVDKVVIIPKVRLHTVDAEPVALALESQLVTIQGLRPKVATIQPVVAKAPKVVASKKVVAKLNKNRYTIQLAAGIRKSDVHRFKQSDPLFSHAKIRHIANSKGNWYILTLGEFQSRQHAARQIEQLPTTVAQLKPWIRPISEAIG